MQLCLSPVGVCTCMHTDTHEYTCTYMCANADMHVHMSAHRHVTIAVATCGNRHIFNHKTQVAFFSVCSNFLSVFTFWLVTPNWFFT